MKRPWAKHLLLSLRRSRYCDRLPSLARDFFNQMLISGPLPEAFMIDNCLPLDLSDPDTYDFAVTARPPFEFCSYEFINPYGVQTVIYSIALPGEYPNKFFLSSWRLQADGWTPSPSVECLDYEKYEGGGSARLVGQDFQVENQGDWIGVYDLLPKVDPRATASWETTPFVSINAVLGCSNIKKAKRYRSPSAARKANEEDAFWVLEIRSTKSVPGPSHGGTHASPRAHLRRGHIRKISDDRRVWVSPTIVNPGAKGAVEKDYQVV